MSKTSMHFASFSEEHLQFDQLIYIYTYTSDLTQLRTAQSARPDIPLSDGIIANRHTYLVLSPHTKMHSLKSFGTRHTHTNIHFRDALYYVGANRATYIIIQSSQHIVNI